MANKAVFGLYTDRRQVENAVDELKAQGFRNTDISVLLPENVGTKDFAHEKGTKAPEGMATGCDIWSRGRRSARLARGYRSVGDSWRGTAAIAAGPIIAALTGVGVGGAVGGITGGLVGLGIPEYEAKRYEGRIKSGNILLSVHADDSKWTDKAERILKDTGAEDISSTSESKGDYANADKPMPRYHQK